MFDFVLLETNGGQLIVPGETSMKDLSPLQMLEYMEADSQLAQMERIQRQEARREGSRRKFIHRKIRTA